MIQQIIDNTSTGKLGVDCYIFPLFTDPERAFSVASQKPFRTRSANSGQKSAVPPRELGDHCDSSTGPSIQYNW